MMKILYVYGDDYAALTFEDDLGGDAAKYWKLADAISGRTYVDEETGIEFKAYTFGEVDPAFIRFIQNTVQDYDDSKHSNFYVVVEENS